MKNYTYTDKCNTLINIESNYDDSFADALVKFKENKDNEVININIADEFDEEQQIGLSVNELKKLISYLNDLVSYFEISK